MATKKTLAEKIAALKHDHPALGEILEEIAGTAAKPAPQQPVQPTPSPYEPRPTPRR